MSEKMTAGRSGKILKILEGYYGDTTPDLNFGNIYELTIAVVLSAQTTDRQVNGVTGTLFKKYPDFKRLAAAEISDVERIIKSTGFFRTKAANIVALSGLVMSRFGGVLPDSIDLLTELPGVGRKSANVIISIGFGKPGLAVDTHVSRIAQRLGYSSSESPAKIENDLCAVIPPDKWKMTHLLFIRHGRVLCKARNPECSVCPLSQLCLYCKGLSFKG